MLERTFEEVQDLPGDAQAGKAQEVEYNFEGFTIDFSRKVMLTPAVTSVDKQARAQARY